MASAKERLKILENIIAKVGVDGDVLGEYARTMASLNGLESLNSMQTQFPQMGQGANSMPMGSPQSPTAPISSQPTQTTPMGVEQPMEGLQTP